MAFHPFTACMLIGTALMGASASAQTRGELLYEAHCRLATDGNSLQAQVVRWQAAGALNWSDEDIAAVTQHLNDRFYGFMSSSSPPVVLTPAGGERP